MKVHNPKNWSQFVFLISKSETPFKLAPMLVLMLVYSLGITYLEPTFLEIFENS